MALVRFSQEPPSEVYQYSTFIFALESPGDQFHRIKINHENSFAKAIIESADYLKNKDDPAKGMPLRGEKLSTFTNHFQREFWFELAITAVGTFNVVVNVYKYRATAKDGADCVGTVKSRLITVLDSDPVDEVSRPMESRPVSPLSKDGSGEDSEDGQRGIAWPRYFFGWVAGSTAGV